MTDRFARAFDAPSPDSLLRPAVTCLQASLYGRLKKRYGNKAGDLGWLLVRLAQPSHRDHASAMRALESRSSEDFGAMLEAVKGAETAPSVAGRSECRDLCHRILAVFSSLGAARAATAAAGELAVLMDLDGRRMDRMSELLAGGMPEEAACAQAIREITS